MRSLVLGSASTVALMVMAGAAMATSSNYCALYGGDYCVEEQEQASSASQLETQRATVQTLATTISGRIARMATGGPGAHAAMFQQAALGGDTLGGDTMSGVSTGDGMGLPIGVWAAASKARLDNDGVRNPFSTDAWSGMVGADVLLDNGALLGMSLSYEDSESHLDLPDGRSDSTGWMLTPYAAMSYLDGALVVDALAGYGIIDTDVKRAVSTAPVSGSYDSTRYMVGANVTYQGVVEGGVLLAAKVGYLYAYEDGDSYVDSSNTAFGDQDSRLGTVRTEGSASWQVFDGMVEPFVAAAFLHDLQRSKVIGGENDRSAIEARVGATFYAGDTFSGGFELMKELGREKLSSESITLSLRAAF